MSRTAFLRILTPKATFPLALGWAGFFALVVFGPEHADHLTTPGLFLVLTAIITVIVICAFGVLTHAEVLAHRLGDPYGTLILTLSIVTIEVILIAAVMLGPGEHPTIARDSVMAVSMIILNLVVGLAIFVGTTRHRTLRANPTGLSTYLVTLAVLLMIAFVLPEFLGDNGAYDPGSAIAVSALTLLLYAYFVYRQLGPQRTDFQEFSVQSKPPAATGHVAAHQLSKVVSQQRGEIVVRILLLVVTVIPIVLLSHDMAALLDIGLDRVGAPVALSGVLIAAIVFLPETLTALRAASQGELQRVSNLCHGALVSTVGLTIPVVLLIGLFTDQRVVLAEHPAHLALLAVTLFATLTSMLTRSITRLHGAVHLMIFLLYLLLVFA